MLCEVCEVHSNSLAKLPYDKYKCIKPRCNEKGSHFHDVCIKCCDKNNSNQIKKSMSKLESNKNNQAFKSNQIFLNKMSDEPESFDENSSNPLARRIKRNNNLKKIKERSQRLNSSK